MLEVAFPPSSLKHQHLFEKNAGHPISSGSLYQKAAQAAHVAFFPFIFSHVQFLSCVGLKKKDWVVNFRAYSNFIWEKER